QPHQLTGLYALGATCSTKTGQVYATSYDAWSNVTSRTYSGTTATLTYDLLDHLIKWYASATNQEQYVYDANGERVLRRSTSSSGTTMTVYAFGLEEHTYTGSGTLLSSTYYYSLAGKLIGALDANGTTFYLTDALGSLLASFSNTANSAALTSNQLYGPYGNARYTAGTLNTAKGFTGQYNDSLTGLDYYNARYYDPVVGVFLSADAIQGNMQGMNPYAYVGGNPETWSDPSGLAAVSSCFATCGGSGHYPTVSSPGNSLLAKAVNNWLNGGARTTVPLIGLLRTEPDHLFVWWKQPQRLHAFRVAGQDCCLRYSAHHSGRGRRLHGGGVGRRLRFFFPVCQHAVIRHGCARSGRGEHDGGRVCRSLWLSGARTGIADKSLEQEYEGVAAQELFALSAEGTPRLPRRRTVWEAPTG
ncbi:MAG TPA: RHS repeat-associated core domain-containing protein, partial [Ktedonobacteraceae bacterium]|nr:RHS repeat-associated core domain-containing protein [Ktedonobacteraceae bacterium]